MHALLSGPVLAPSPIALSPRVARRSRSGKSLTEKEI
jgi:hypothetical protein